MTTIRTAGRAIAPRWLYPPVLAGSPLAGAVGNMSVVASDKSHLHVLGVSKEASALARLAQMNIGALGVANAVPTGFSAALGLQRDMEKLYPNGLQAAFAQVSAITKQFDRLSMPLQGLLEEHERRSAAISQLVRLPELHRDIRTLVGPSFPVAFHEAVRAQNEVARLSSLVNAGALSRALASLSEAVARATGAITAGGATPIALRLDQALAPALASWRTMSAAVPERPATSELNMLTAVGRASFGLAASSAELVAGGDAIAGLDRWEISPEAIRERMLARLEKISPRLVERLEGAWSTLRGGGPDAASQSAHSAVELIDWLLRKTCDPATVLAWIAERGQGPDDIDPRGRPTRTARIRYLMRDRPLEAEITVAHARSLRAVHQQLEKVKHSDGEQDPDVVAKLIYTVESLLIVVVE